MTVRILLHVRVEGLENIPRNGPVLLVSNHPSYLEPILLVDISQIFVQRPLAFMAWDRLFKIPVVGGVIRSFGAYPVDMDNPGRKPYETLLTVLREGGMAGVFPEGGRSTGDLMDEWKPGALRAALSTDPVIVPVSVIGARGIWHRNAVFPRLFRRVTLRFHPGRKLMDMGAGPTPSGSAKDWLKAIEAQLRDEINAPMIEAERKSEERTLANYLAATPAGEKRRRGELWLCRKGRAPTP